VLIFRDLTDELLDLRAQALGATTPAFALVQDCCSSTTCCCGWLST
jgi:hypothetical protein